MEGREVGSGLGVVEGAPGRGATGAAGVAAEAGATPGFVATGAEAEAGLDDEEAPGAAGRGGTVAGLAAAAAAGAIGETGGFSAVAGAVVVGGPEAAAAFTGAETAGLAAGRDFPAVALACFSASAAASCAASWPKCLRTSSALSGSRELEWVFFSVTPISGKKSIRTLALISSSRASSLMRI